MHQTTSSYQSNFKEQIDSHEGRVRRKAVFGNEMDVNDLKDSGEDDDSDSSDNEEEENDDDEDVPSHSDFSADEEDNAKEMGNASKWKESLSERTALRQKVNLMQLVYGKPESESLHEMKDTSKKESDDEDDEFFKPKGEGKRTRRKESIIMMWTWMTAPNS